ncbi:MAG: substrate-binding domain-containing protein [Oscillospiraceae bacterium]|nr:substrate-binding domain-containing protein [Oscillospiraceae bacterium]
MRKNKTRIMKAITAGVFALSMLPMAGCNRNQPEPVETVNVAVIVKDKSSTYWNPVEKACEDLTAELGDAVHIDFMGPDEESVEKQIPLIEKAISDKVDAIVLAACDPEAENETLAKATAANIPVITIDSDVTYEGKASYVGTMNVTAGKTAARYAATLLDNEGTIGVIYHGNASTAIERRDGFLEQLQGGGEPEKELAAGAGTKQNNSVPPPPENVSPEETANNVPDVPEGETVPVDLYANIKIAEVLDGESKWDVSKEQAIKLIKNDHVNLIFATNRKGAWGACEAVNELIESGDIKQGQVKVIGFDYFENEGKDAGMYLEKNILDTIIIQNPYNMGYLGVRYAVDIAKGNPIPSKVDTGAILVTQENINDADIQFLISN